MTSTNKRTFAACVLFASLAAFPPLRAQSPADTVLHIGDRIRVQSPFLGAKPKVGNFVSVAADTLFFTLEGQTVPTGVPVAQVAEVDVSVGNVKNRPAVQKRSLVAEIIGAAVGALIGIEAGSGSSRMKALLGAAGGLGGYFAGRAYGTITVPSTVEKWQPVTLQSGRT